MTTNENIINAINAIVKKAQDNRKDFVFGETFYTPEEARTAMLEHAEDDMEHYGLTLEEYIARQTERMADAPHEYAICVNNGTETQIIDTFQQLEELDASAAEDALGDFFAAHPEDTPHGIYSIESISNGMRVAVIYARDCDAE